jgi:hypothetical protein
MTDLPPYSDGPGADGPDPDDERLRRLLDRAVSDIEPREGLDSIHARTKVSPMSPKRPWLYAAAGAVAATAVTVAAISLAGSDAPQVGDGADVAAATSPDSAPASGPASTPAPAPPASEPPSNQGTSPAPVSDEAVPVYYVGETTRGPRLFREFHRLEVPGADQLTPALREALSTAPDDPDYRTDWPQGTTLANVSVDGSGEDATIDIALANDDLDLAERPSGMSAAEARMAVQQLIYTAQAALQSRAPVEFYLADGDDLRPADRLLGVPVSGPTRQGDPVEVLAQVWIIDPGEGAEVGSTFEVSGLAAAFEANVQWELMKGEQQIRRGFTTAEECCTMAPYSFKVRNVPAGEYTVVVHDSDASGGEGPGPWVDTKTVTVTDG